VPRAASQLRRALTGGVRTEGTDGFPPFSRPLVVVFTVRARSADCGVAELPVLAIRGQDVSEHGFQMPTAYRLMIVLRA